MIGHASAIEAAAHAVEVSRDGGFWWRGERADWYPARLLSGLDTSERQALTLAALAECLYENFYRHGVVRPLPPPAARDSVVPDPIPLGRLTRANTGSGVWQSGWEVISTDASGRLRVRRGGLTLTAEVEAVRHVDSGRVIVRLPRETYAMSPGFYSANFDNLRRGSDPPARLYWHLVPAGAEAFVNEVTRLCNEAGVGGSLKVVSDRSSFDRCDSGVVYVAPQGRVVDQIGRDRGRRVEEGSVVT